MSKLMFSSSLVIGTLISISSYSWMGMWMGLEINLLSIIPMMSNSKNMYSTEAALKYFITQALASAMLLFSIIILSTNVIYNTEMNVYPSLIMNSALMTKMGAAPFHFWFPEVMEGLNWMNCFILLTWQKLAPMVLVIYSNNSTNFITLVIMSCMVISGILGLNQVSLRKIMAFSSINHIGWMLAALLFNETIWMYNYVIYVVITANILVIFGLYNVFFMKQLFSILNHNNLIKLFFVLNFLSLGGLPPFLGFMPKWLVIQSLVNSNLFSTAIIMVLMTLITLYFYMRVTFSSILLTMSSPSYYSNKYLNYPIIIVINTATLASLILCTLIFNLL